MSDRPSDSVADLVEQYREAVRAGDHAPEAMVGRLDLPTALEAQLAVLRDRLAAGEELGGFKVGLTSARARQAVGADVRPFGHILAGRILGSGAVIDSRALRKGSLEAELCFTIGHRLAGEVSAADARAAVARVAAGFELNESRPGSARPDLGLLVADNLTQWGIVEGSGKDIAGVGDLAEVECRVERNGAEVYTGRSGDVLDDHFASLARLAGVLAEHGQALEPGYKVITGAFCRFDLVPGDSWRARYSAIGEVDVRVV